MRPYAIAYGKTAEHAAALKLGITKLPADFDASVCGVCDGLGEYEQTYTHGCGRGYFRAVGTCDYCDGTGLLSSSGRPAPDSVREQVLNAARR